MLMDPCKLVAQRRGTSAATAVRATRITAPVLRASGRHRGHRLMAEYTSLAD
ncbi:MAG TPA: hypothetical protein VE420_05640 [Gemmatimonadales bacterium]|nr:hypothetical protein [Gemmatimonadales bacterium]